MDCNKRLHIKVNGPSVELQTGFNRNKIIPFLIESETNITIICNTRSEIFTWCRHEYRLPVWIQPTGHYSYTQSLAHNTERLVNYDWAITYINLYYIHLFHTYTYITNSEMREYYFLFFTIEKYKTLMIGPLGCALYINSIKPETCFDTPTPLRTRSTKVQDQCAKNGRVKSWQRGRAFHREDHTCSSPFHSLVDDQLIIWLMWAATE